MLSNSNVLQQDAPVLLLSQDEFYANVKQELNSTDNRSYIVVDAKALSAMAEVANVSTSLGNSEARECFQNYERNGMVFPITWKAFQRQLRPEGSTDGKSKSYTVDDNGKLQCGGQEVLALEEYYPRMMSTVADEFGGELTPKNLKNVQKRMGERFYMNESLLSLVNVFRKNRGRSQPDSHRLPPSSSGLENYGNSWAMGPWHPPSFPVGNHMTYHVTNNITNNTGSGNVFMGATNMSGGKRVDECDVAVIKGGIQAIEEGMRNLNGKMQEQNMHLRAMSTAKKGARPLQSNTHAADVGGATTPNNLLPTVSSDRFYSPPLQGEKLFQSSSLEDSIMPSGSASPASHQSGSGSSGTQELGSGGVISDILSASNLRVSPGVFWNCTPQSHQSGSELFFDLEDFSFGDSPPPGVGLKTDGTVEGTLNEQVEAFGSQSQFPGASSATQKTVPFGVGLATDVAVESASNEEIDGDVSPDNGGSVSRLQEGDIAIYKKENRKFRLVKMVSIISTLPEEQYWECQPINENGGHLLGNRRFKAKSLIKIEE